jgi:hypothetical protein
MIRHHIVALSGTPADLTIADQIQLHNTISVQNIHESGNAYLGSGGVTDTDYGHKLGPGESVALDISRNDSVYAVGDSGVFVAVLTLDVE